MARGILAFLADDLTDPFLELRLGEIVVIDPSLVPGVVRRVNVDAFNAACVSGKKRFQSQEIVAFDNQVPFKVWFLAFGQERQFRVKLKRVVGKSVMITLNRSFSLKL